MNSKSTSIVRTNTEYATCSCGSGVPVQTVEIAGDAVTLIALPIFFERFYRAGKVVQTDTISMLMEQVQIYNPIPLGKEAAFREMLTRDYAIFCAAQDSMLWD